MLTPEQYKHTRELCEKVSPNTWTAGICSSEAQFVTISDTAFVGEARTLLPLLLDEIDRLKKLLQADTTGAACSCYQIQHDENCEELHEMVMQAHKAMYGEQEKKIEEQNEQDRQDNENWLSESEMSGGPPEVEA